MDLPDQPSPQKPSTQERYSCDIEYEIKGHDIQMVEVILDPEESVIGENGAMIYFDAGVQMNTQISDGGKNSGIVGSVLGAAKRKMTGEGMFIGYFTNKGREKAKVGFSSPYPGMIIPIDLSYHSGHIYCQKGSFLCGARGVSVSIGITKRVGAGVFGGEGFILQSVKGDGIAFIHAGGTIVERTLQPGEKLYVDTGSIVGFESTVKFDIKVLRGFKNIFFGNENLFLSTLEGPGKVWIQSMPFNEMVNMFGNALMTWAKKKKK